MFTLEYLRGEWMFFNDKDMGGNLLLPFECYYNDKRSLRLETNGKVYMVERKKMTRTELRIVNGEWSYDATDHWQSIFDLDERE